MRLEWEGGPVATLANKGYCYTDKDGQTNGFHTPKVERQRRYFAQQRLCPDMEAGRLSSSLPEAARALEIANATSYWTSVRKRVKDRTILEVENLKSAKTGMSPCLRSLLMAL